MLSIRRIRIILERIFILLCLCTTLAWSETPAYRKGELLVKFKPDRRSRALERYADDNHIVVRRTLSNSRLHQLQLPADLSVAEAMEMYRADPAVDYAEPNYLLSTQTLPDDPFFERLWALSNKGQVVGGYTGIPGADLDAERAWQITEGGPDTIVAVIDTGVNYCHPDIEANLWTNPFEIPDNGLDDDGNGLIDDVHGWDFADHDPIPMDASGHGTHVAGIIAAEGNNGTGVAGVAWRVRIMPLRFMNAFDTGSTADAIAAIEYAEAAGVRIINCSWGSTGYSISLRETMADSRALFICAAGNAGSNNDTSKFYPAGFALPNVLSVAASDQADELAWFSNFGRQTVHVAAPGIRIFNLANARRSVWQENFDTQWIDNWTFGGDPDFWTSAIPPNGRDTALSGAPAGGYDANVDAWAVTPALDLSQAEGATLKFRLLGGCPPGADHLTVELSADRVNWHPSPLKLGGSVVYTGVSEILPYWTPVMLDLGSWEGRVPVYVRFRFRSDDSESGEGFYIDDLNVSTCADGESYTYMAGTSMAAAYVSGLAALVNSRDPNLTGPQIKDIITTSVDLLPNLKDCTISGGRIDALNALTLLTHLNLSAQPAASDRVTLTWKATEPIESPVVIERRAGSQPEFIQVAVAESGSSDFIDNHLVPNTTYYYRVQAQTADGRTGYSNQSEATTPDGSSDGAGSGGSGGGGGCFLGTLKITW